MIDNCSAPLSTKETALRVFPARLAEARHAAGLTQAALAETAGISATTLARYEAGTAEAGCGFVLAAANILNVSCDWLLGRATALGDVRASQIAALVPVAEGLASALAAIA